MSRLDQFLDVDDSARDRAAVISSLAGIGGYLVARFVFDIAGEALGYAVIGVVACAYLVRLWWYCNISSDQVDHADSRPFTIPRRLVMLAASACVFALFIIVPPTVVEAAVIERRLRASTREVPLSTKEAESISDALTVASNGPIPISSSTLAAVREAIKTSEPNSAVARAAMALLKYKVAINPPAKINPPRTDAGRAYLEGAEHFAAAMAQWPTHLDVNEANASISAFSRAMELAGADPSLRIDALLIRATLYNNLGRTSEALADIQSAERLGALDLSSIISIETTAMLIHREPGDLKQAISLATLGLQISPPQWALSHDTRMDAMYRVSLLEKRATAYSLLGEFAKSEADRQTIAALIRRAQANRFGGPKK